MDPCPTREQLRLMLANQLPPAELTVVEAHVAECATCRPFLDNETNFTDVIADIVGVVDRQGDSAAGSGSPSVTGFQIGPVLGRGGHGVVYRAVNLTSGRTVALKILRAGLTATPAERARFRINAQALSRLEHPNIVTLWSVGESDGHPYLEIDFLPDGSLADLPKDILPAERDVIHFLNDLAAAVEYAHANGVIHRDLKPANVLLRRRDGQLPDSLANFTPVLADFSIAKIVSAVGAATPTIAILGTPEYMAPEAASGRVASCGPAVDIYGLGAVAYQLLTGRPPFQGSTPYDTIRMVLDGPPPGPRMYRQDLTQAIDTVVLKCLAFDPLDRYPSPAALRQDLDRLLAGQPIAARPISTWRRWCRRAKRHPRVTALLASFAAVILVSLTGLTLLYRRAESNAALAQYRYELARDTFRTVSGLREEQSYFPNGITEADEPSLRKLFELQQTVLPDYRNDPDAWHDTAYGMLQRGKQFGMINRHELSRSCTEHGRQALRELTERYPDNQNYRHSYAEACMQLSGCTELSGDWTRTRQLREEAIGIIAELLVKQPNRVKFLVTAAAFERSHAGLLDQRGEWQEAERHYVNSISSWQKLIDRSPNDAQRRHYYAGALLWYAEFVSDHYHDYDAVTKLSETAWAQAIEIRSIAPEQAVWYTGLTDAAIRLASTQYLTGQPDRAHQTLEAAANVVRPIIRDKPGYEVALGKALQITKDQGYLRALVDQAQPDRAFEDFHATLQIAEQQLPKSHGIARYRADFHVFGQSAGAHVPEPRRGVEFYQSTDVKYLPEDYVKCILVTALCRAGRFSDAVTTFESITTRPVGAEAPYRLCVLYYAQALWALGQKDHAKTVFRTASDTLRRYPTATLQDVFHHNQLWRQIEGTEPPRPFRIQAATTVKPLYVP